MYADSSRAPYQTSRWPIAGRRSGRRRGCTWPASADAVDAPACPADPHWRGRPRPRPRPHVRRCSVPARTNVCNIAGDISLPSYRRSPALNVALALSSVGHKADGQLHSCRSNRIAISCGGCWAVGRSDASHDRSADEPMTSLYSASWSSVGRQKRTYTAKQPQRCSAIAGCHKARWMTDC